MKAGWKRVKLGDCLDFLSGKAKPKISGSYPIYGSNGIIGMSPEYMYENAFIIGRVGAVGELVWCAEKFWASDNTIVARPKADIIDIAFAFYTLRVSNLKGDVHGSAQPLITKSGLRDIDCWLPPLPTQRRIAAVLGALDDKIELNRKMNANLEAQAQTLFKSWFVDFEPWGGKMPKEWKMCTLGDISTNVRERVGCQDRVVLSAVATGKLVPSDVYFTKQVFSADISKYIIVDENDFAYNPSRINIGSIGINDLGVKGCVSPVYVCVRFANEYENYFRFFIKSKQFQDEAKVRAIGSVRQSLNYSDFALIECCYPTVEDVRLFNNAYCSLHQLQRSVENESRKLAETRDALLPKLMSGEVEA